MERKKVKEIKKALRYNVQDEFMNRLPYGDEFNKLKMVSFEDILTYINELESELEKEQINNLNCDTELQYKEKRIADLESENEKLKQHKRELQGGQHDLCVLNKEQTLRIAELKEDKEKWQRKAINYYQIAKSYGVECIIDNDIDETLKEFINNK